MNIILHELPQFSMNTTASTFHHASLTVRQMRLSAFLYVTHPRALPLRLAVPQAACNASEDRLAPQARKTELI